MKTEVQFTVNGEPVAVMVEPHTVLLDVLRDELGLTGAKEGCGLGECGACTVIMNGISVNSCLVLAMEAEGAEILTVEGLAAPDGRLDPVQRAFVELGAVQCGFCTPGMVMSAKALLNENPDPTVDEIKRGLAGNICRCTGYNQIVDAVRAAAERTRKG